jgi:hypothetical protein
LKYLPLGWDFWMLGRQITGSLLCIVTNYVKYIATVFHYFLHY